jgi:hypothetical protein
MNRINALFAVAVAAGIAACGSGDRAYRDGEYNAAGV